MPEKYIATKFQADNIIQPKNINIEIPHKCYINPL